MVTRGRVRSQQHIARQAVCVDTHPCLAKGPASISIGGDLDQNARIEQENLTRACLISNPTQSLFGVIKNKVILQ